MKKVDFSDGAITTLEEIRSIVGSPHELVIKKTIAMVDEQCKKFIRNSPIVFISTSDNNGNCDVSPRGDHPGFVYCLNDYQLVIPDRPGNRRVDSLQNILSNPHIGLVFLIPGLDEVLRINGRATIIKNKDILGQMSLNGKPPLLGIGVDVLESFIHCPRALKESKVWSSDEWPDIENVPTMMEIFHAHLEINGVKVKE